MIVGHVWNYSYLTGWTRLIANFLREVESAMRGHEFQMIEFKEQDGWLIVKLLPVGDVPEKIVTRINELCVGVRQASQFICVDCGAAGLNYFWQGEWLSPCCPQHAREKAKDYLDEFQGEGWRLTEDWRLVDNAGVALSADTIAARRRDDMLLDAAIWLTRS
jgi:hypothetical protein